MKRRGVVVRTFWRTTYDLVRLNLTPMSSVHLRASAVRTLCGVRLRTPHVVVGRIVLQAEPEFFGTRFLASVHFLCCRCSGVALAHGRALATREARKAS